MTIDPHRPIGESGGPELPWLGTASDEDMRRIVQALFHVHRLIAAITDLDTLLERITEESRLVAGAEASSLMLYDEVAQELYFLVALGETGDQETLKREIRLKLGQGIAGMTAAARTSINVEDARTDPRVFREADVVSRFETRNLLAVPMLDKENLVGVLEVVNKIDGPAFSTRDMHVMEIFSSLAATSVANARLIEEQIRTERLAAIGQALTGLSHYIKNIVTGLSSSGDLIDMGLERGNLEVLHQSWPVFRRSTKRISNFVQDMLSFSKPRTPVRERCDLAGILEEARQTFAELFVRKRIEVQVDTSGVGGPVYVEAQALYRCLLNLITNAGDAVPAHGGRITVAARSLGGTSVEISVSDNGPGVAEEHRPRIFDPFFSTKGAQGTGLGLAITQKIVREHGGDITLAEGEGSGTTFRMVLPAHVAPGEGSENT